MSKEFYETRNLFIPFVNYINPLTYDEWLSVSDDKKAAHLYCQFFNEIILAWNKAKSFYAEEQEGVETVLQYIIKNVPIIKQDRKRFTASYMYRISYNCLYCISRDRIGDKWRYENVISNNQLSAEGDPIDLFDFYACYDEYVCEADESEQLIRQWVWKLVEDHGKCAVKLAEALIDGKKELKTLCNRDQKLINVLRVELFKVLPFYYDDHTIDLIIQEFNHTITEEVIK